jgi:hypothetical protein
MSEGAADGGECSRRGLRSSIAERGRVAGAIKAWFASIGFCGLAAVGPAFAQAPENGDELARMMIKQAESGGGRVDMHRFGDGACFVAEGLSAAYVARRQFPGYPVAYREADPGNGLWFILLAATARRTSGSMRSSRASCVGTCRRTRGSVMRWCVAIPRTSRPPRPSGPGRSSSPCPEAADSRCRSRNRGRWAALRSAHPAAYAPGVHPVAIVHSRSSCNRSIWRCESGAI